MPSRRLRRASPTPLHRRILRGISNAGAYLTGWNAPGGAPRGATVVIGPPRLISSLDLFPEDIPGRPRNHDANQQADEHNNDPTSPAIDYESEELRLADLFRRIRFLSNDANFQHLSKHDWNLRTQALDWYREDGFLRDLANGRHDGFAEALRNQGKSSYRTPISPDSELQRFADFWILLQSMIVTTATSGNASAIPILARRRLFNSVSNRTGNPKLPSPFHRGLNHPICPPTPRRYLHPITASSYQKGTSRGTFPFALTWPALSACTASSILKAFITTRDNPGPEFILGK